MTEECCVVEEKCIIAKYCFPEELNVTAEVCLQKIFVDNPFLLTTTGGTSDTAGTTVTSRSRTAAASSTLLWRDETWSGMDPCHDAVVSCVVPGSGHDNACSARRLQLRGRIISLWITRRQIRVMCPWFSLAKKSNRTNCITYFCSCADSSRWRIWGTAM